MNIIEFRKVVRQEIRNILQEKVILTPGSMRDLKWVIYAETNGKKKEITRIPAAKLNTTLRNIGERYHDDPDVTIAAVAESDWDKLQEK